MTTNYHTAIPTSPAQPANALTVNGPLSELDTELVAQDGRITALEADMPVPSGVASEYYDGSGGFSVPSGTGSTNGHVIQDEGVDQTQRVKLNFTGAGVTVVDTPSATEVQIAMSDHGALTGLLDADHVAGSIAFTATDKLLGRSTSGAGAGEEIPLTAAGRALIAAINAAAMRTLLELDDGWLPDANTWTYYNRTQAYTNDPAAGANITLNMTDTTGFVVGDIVQVSSSAGSENTMITTVVANTSITVNILELNHTTSSPLVTSLGKFTVAGDYSAVFTKQTRVKWTQTTVKYGTVLYSSHSGGTTTVSIALNSDFTITNAAISSNYYSYLDSPRDWPEWFNFVPGQIGFSAKPTNTVYRYSPHGKKMSLQLRQTSAGTSNATNFVMGLPVMAATVTNMAWMSSSCIVDDNSVGATTPGLITVASAGTVLNVYKDQQLAGFTASGGKRLALGNIVYEW